MNLSRVTIKNNKAKWGGGIYNCANLTMEDSIIASNTATRNCGGIKNTWYAYTKLSKVVVKDNKAKEENGGIGIYADSTVVIEDCSIIDNVAGNDGGGISIGARGILYLYRSVITGNTAKNGGGIMNNNTAYIDDFSISNMISNNPNNFAGNPHIPA
ncbi:MAG: hypothetical protein PHY59_08825 [Methanobacterium sp.]|nr:hypothetical protein [Methanobacterium sp.]